MKNINDNNYIYASTLVRAADGRGTARERLDIALDCKSLQALYDALTEFGIAEKNNTESAADTAAKTEALLSNALESSVTLVRNSSPTPEIYNFLLYKYDCNNIKTAIKCDILKTDGKDLYFKCGTLSPETIVKSEAARNFIDLPSHMGEAAAEAIKAYERTGEARAIDLILDCACFADMSSAALDAGVEFFIKYTEAMADSVNIRTAVRISASHIPHAAAVSLMKRAEVPGGTLPSDVFFSESGVCSAEEIASYLPLSPIKCALSGADTDISVNTSLEVYLDKIVSEYSSKPFGSEVPACFLIEREREIKRYRKLAALLSAGITKKEILKERIGLH